MTGLMHRSAVSAYNGQALSVEEIPMVSLAEFREWLVAATAQGALLSGMLARPSGGGLKVIAAMSSTSSSGIAVSSTELLDEYPALTRDVPQAHWFERELAEQWGVVPAGHPWLKPIRFHHSYRPGHDAWGRAVGDVILPAVTDYFSMDGDAVHEVAVGPIHAGVIEPGHFRFLCHGETVYHLEIALGYQHRGIERQMVQGRPARRLHYMETLAGDTSVGHATAYCQALEGLAGQEAPFRAQALRTIGLELERLANHTGDLGALAVDVGFLPTSSYCGRLRGDFLNATAAICGNRFGRSLVRPGGVGWDVNDVLAQTLQQRVSAALRDVTGATQLLWNCTSAQARYEDCGTVSRSTAIDLGLVGMAARACGIDRDVRRDFPAGYYRFAQVPVSLCRSGDVFARTFLRWLELERSAQFVIEQLRVLPPGPIHTPLRPLKPDHLVVSLVEAWRGEICHMALTDSAGQLAGYKVVDPSFHNWIGLAMALRNQQISDFPVNNKSFNLSYCGHDL
jgi:Ni,Fe-hydrogenase III large subunit